MPRLRHARVLLLLLLPLVPAASGLFAESAAWLQTCLSPAAGGGSAAASCSPGLAAAASFWYLSLNQQVQWPEPPLCACCRPPLTLRPSCSPLQPTTDVQPQLAAACSSGCIDATLAQLPSLLVQDGHAGSTAGLLPSASAAAALATAAGRFLCLSPPAAAGGSAAGPGACVASISSALAAANMTAQIRCVQSYSLPLPRAGGAPPLTRRSICRALDAGLLIPSHSGFQQLCAGLRQAGCCAVAWLRLAAAASRQLCRGFLSDQLLLLPGSCGLGDSAAPCGPGFAAELLPLVQLRQDCPGADALNGTIAGRDYWGGTACSPLQRSRARCPATAADAWCGYLSDANAAGGAWGVAQASSVPGHSTYISC
jgi:hypothetical protein